MVEDKYVGLALAVSGTVAIGSSFIITKKVRHRPLVVGRPHHPSPRASTRQEKEGIRILKRQMTTRTLEIPFGGQGWQ